VTYVNEGWWAPNVKSGQVHDHPKNPGQSWSVTMHRECEPVYTKRTIERIILLEGGTWTTGPAWRTILTPEDEEMGLLLQLDEMTDSERDEWAKQNGEEI
jgi:hypothetical protein